MILVTFEGPDGDALVGVKTDTGVVPTRTPAGRLAEDGLAVLPELERAARSGAAPAAEGELRLLAPVPRPGKVLCVGLNYLRHARESGMEPPTAPVLFSKFGNAVAGPGDDVALPREAERYDYEAELVAVIGRRARRVSEEHALEHVLGYCNGNDLSARDLQMLSGQWLLGKTLDGFLPMGPYLATADEVPDPQDLRVRCWLNGEQRQDSNTADMIFSVAEIVAYASRYMTLEPGDVIATGTPEGVILGRAEKRWMVPGDEVVVEVGPLGRLVNRMVEG